MKGNEGNQSGRRSRTRIPKRLRSFIQDYDFNTLDIARHGNLLIERTLQFGTWVELRWLLRVYGSRRIAKFLREMGERNLSPEAFNYWRKMFRVRTWRHSPFPISRGEIWPH
jgi:hypothetical protein